MYAYACIDTYIFAYKYKFIYIYNIHMFICLLPYGGWIGFLGCDIERPFLFGIWHLNRVKHRINLGIYMGGMKIHIISIYIPMDTSIYT
jgi:hypothetical protein